jgi:hypothetical protein
VLEGKNCFLRNISTGQSKSYGFFASRFVEATDSQAAVDTAIQIIKDELYSQELLKNTPIDPPTILVEKVCNVASFDPSVPTKGFTFYIDDTSLN